MLVTADFGRTISFWHVDSGKLARHLPGRLRFGITAYRIGDEGKTLVASCCDDSSIRFFKLADGSEQRRLIHPRQSFIVSLDLADDGKVLLSQDVNGEVLLWDAVKGQVHHQFQSIRPPPQPTSSGGDAQPHAVLTPDGKHLILAQPDASLHLIDTTSGKEVRAIETGPANAKLRPNQRIERLVVSPDGRRLAIADSKGTIAMAELAKGKLTQRFKQKGGGITSLVFTPDGRSLAVASSTGVFLYETTSGKELRHFPTPYGSAVALLFSPDGQTLATVEPNHSVHLWDAASGRPLHKPVGHTESVAVLLFLPDGKRLVSSGGRDGVIVWDVPERRIIEQRRLLHDAYSLTLGDDGKTLRSLGDDRALLSWRPGMDREVRRREASVPMLSRSGLSPDGETLVVTTSDKRVYLQDLRTERKKRFLPGARLHGDSLLFSPDNRLLAGHCQDGKIRLWSRATGEIVRELNVWERSNPYMGPAAFARDGRSLAVFGSPLRVFEIASGEERLRVRTPGGTSFALACSPDGRLLACGLEDGRIVVYGTATGEKLADWRGRQGWIHALAFSDDGRLLASGGSTGPS
jgi:WD40 repeat protein